MWTSALRYKSSALNEIGKTFAGSLFLCLAAQIAFFVPFSPVPITLYPLTLLLLAKYLGKTKATMAVIAYIAEGLMGFPVFAGGMSGWMVFLGPRGFFLISFVLATYVAGHLFEKGALDSRRKTFVAGLATTFTIYAVVLPLLSTLIGFERAVIVGFLPFIVGDILKVGLFSLFMRKN